ncbi:MAG TPA: amidohydrolase family protein, partial [Dehalococcoidia bacterium]|nr:amidohydrolase family protein [Dehalococcoidia bacterium]
SSLPHGDSGVEATLRVMDQLGIALIAFDAQQAPPDGVTQGYRWSYAVHELANAHPDRFIVATNGGVNPNWTSQRGGREIDFVDQLERQVKGGEYPLIGEIEFRHYLSSQQCAAGRKERDVNVPLNGPNGHRVFRLAAETGIPLSIHFEPEDDLIPVLEEMLTAYPAAKVIVAHFGQVRHPEKQTRFGPELVRRLLKTHRNLNYDISTGYPGRRYECNRSQLDTVIWEDFALGGQKRSLKPAYRDLLVEFSDRFVTGFDYGGMRKALPDFLRDRVANARLILSDLPDEVKHDIGYRNAWRLLTGRNWPE